MPLIAVDLFAGAGGATQGLRDAGFEVCVAVEIDAEAATTWAANHPGVMLQRDVRTLTGTDLMDAGGFRYGELDLLKACPPCQGFSTLRGGRTADPRRNDLVLDTLRLIEDIGPKAVLVENVPGLRKDDRFSLLTEGLRKLGYGTSDYIVEASDLGVPQRRRRLVIVAIRHGENPPGLDKLIPSNVRRPAMNAGEALKALEAQGVGGTNADVWRVSQGTVAARIAAVPINGTRFDLPISLQLECHKKMVSKSGKPSKSAAGSYGRVRNKQPAPTMTTRCTTPACGSFIHPSENRGLSLREAAAFQTFPFDYKWTGTYGSIERQIGNAVPVWMAEELGRAVVKLLELRT